MPKTPDAEIQKTRTFFDKPRKDRGLLELSPSQRFVFSTITSLMPEGRDDRTALELGCHWGKYCLYLAKSYGRVVGLDFAPEALRTAVPHPRIHYQACDLDKHPEQLKEFSSVDFYLAVGLFEMLQNPQDLLREMRRHAGPGARLFIVIPNPSSINFIILRLLLWIRGTLLRKHTETIYHNKMTPERLHALIGDSGFSLEREGLVVGLPIYLLDRFPPKLQEKLLRWDFMALRYLQGSYYWVMARV